VPEKFARFLLAARPAERREPTMEERCGRHRSVDEGGLMSLNIGDVPGAALDEMSHARALDLLDQQRRRILDLSGLVCGGERTLRISTATPVWRSPARFEFDSRMSDLRRSLARCSGSLQAALAECDRARELLRSGCLNEGSRGQPVQNFAGHPAGTPRK
jgi:hypothetical protein